jgi:hypothetical protein
MSERIIEEVTSWRGVEADTGELGEFGFKVGTREIGHLHGEHVAHFSFPHGLWDDLLAQHRIAPHPVFPDKRGPASRRIDNEDDVRDVIVLLRINYDRAIARSSRRHPEALTHQKRSLRDHDR